MLQTLAPRTPPKLLTANEGTISKFEDQNSVTTKNNQSEPEKRRLKAYERRQDDKGLALNLAQQIKLLQEKPEFAPFRLELEITIRKIRKKGEQSPEKNRRAVRKAMQSGAATAKEIGEDTGLSKSDVKTILDELDALNLLRITIQYRHPNTPRAYETKLYFLRENTSAE